MDSTGTSKGPLAGTYNPNNRFPFRELLVRLPVMGYSKKKP